ncbi:MAG: metal-dependent transcriptional regulator [Thermoplasmata archaeon]
MEALQRLSRRQVDALLIVRRLESPDHGASLGGIAAALKVRPPSALGHLTPLEVLGLISRYRGKSRLTEKGHGTLEEYRRHHRVAETLFGSLGLAPAETCAAAREIDLAISHRTVEELCRAQRHPSACPHGEPIAPCHTPDRGN